MIDTIFAQTVPEFGPYQWLMLASRFLHVVGAIVMVGGLFYLWAVVAPAIASEGGGTVDRYFGGRREAWAKWVGIASLFLLVTGLWNFISMVKANQLHFTYHILGLVKIILGLALMFLAALLAGRTAAADSMRLKWTKWLTVALLIGFITVGVGSLMRSYPRTPKLDQTPQTLITP